jgi:sugar phosphate isomerase/epimerase
VFTALLAQMPLDDVIAKLKGLGVSTVELGTGNYPGDPHCKLSMVQDKAARKDFQQKLSDNGITISALSCHGNPLHPNPVRAKHDQEVSKQTILLAEKLGVPVVIDFSGCPGDSDKAKYPNWVTCPWPPEYLDVLAWQIRVLGDSIFHVHAKDTQIYDRNLPRTGVLDTKLYTDEQNRSWIFRTCGYGHGAEWWKEFISTLRMYGYDYVLSIEHEDSILSPEEGLRKAIGFLDAIVIKEQPSAPWWV